MGGSWGSPLCPALGPSPGVKLRRGGWPREAGWVVKGGTVASEPTFEASCSIPICVSRSRRRRRGAGRPTSPRSPRPHTGGGALTTTKTRTKALLGAAALQVAAVVTLTDWSSDGNLRPTPQPDLACAVPQPTSGWGAQVPGRGAQPGGVWGRPWRQPLPRARAMEQGLPTSAWQAQRLRGGGETRAP